MVKSSDWKDADEDNSKTKPREISNVFTSNGRKNAKLYIQEELDDQNQSNLPGQGENLSIKSNPPSKLKAFFKKIKFSKPIKVNQEQKELEPTVVKKHKDHHKFKRMLAKAVEKMKRNKNEVISFDFQRKVATPTILKDNSIPLNLNEVQPVSTTLQPTLYQSNELKEHKAYEGKQIISPEPKPKLNISYIKMEEKSIGSEQGESSEQENELYDSLNPISPSFSPVYVRVGWEEYPVMAIMNPDLDINIIPMKMALHIGVSPNKRKSKEKL
ncbi:hypothetical protein O181_100674, partial [Austropuccinia psidii MF-1]|nr:hypothetical protein [Austropuccinia psidii MF-1]